jgi:gluconolactonase
MYGAPPEIPASVFARLPEALKTADASHEWVATQPSGGPARSLLEGPSFDRSGNLWCVDLPNGHILKISPEGVCSVVARYDGWPNGLKIHRDGRVFIADHKHGIMVLDPARGEVRPYLERVGVERFKGVNDLFFAANGDLYFTDQGLTDLADPTGRLFRARADGRIDCLLKNIPSPNGLVMNLDETALYLAVTRANAIWRVPLARDGGVVKVGVFIQMSGGGGPDGLALDAEGRLLVAHVGMGTVWVFDHLGTPVGRIRSPAGLFTTNLAFGGPDNRALFITESASATILRAEMTVPGKRMFSHSRPEGS